ncbi:ATPase [Vibrio ostreicida]|uniref:ATPase n=1 Tax=Vibrio ostreicida TaxID=526588 RepID=UPI003B5B60F6
MKKRTRLGFYCAGGISLLITLIPLSSWADNPGFPPVDNRPEQAAEQTRFFVKYHQGTEQQVRDLLRSHDIDVVEQLSAQSVLVISAKKESIEKISMDKRVDYVEPEPIRRLYSQ